MTAMSDTPLDAARASSKSTFDSKVIRYQKQDSRRARPATLVDRENVSGLFRGENRVVASEENALVTVAGMEACSKMRPSMTVPFGNQWRDKDGGTRTPRRSNLNSMPMPVCLGVATSRLGVQLGVERDRGTARGSS